MSENVDMLNKDLHLKQDEFWYGILGIWYSWTLPFGIKSIKMTNQECAKNWFCHIWWLVLHRQPANRSVFCFVNQRMITLQYCDGFLPYININRSQVCLLVVLSGQCPLWRSALSLGGSNGICGPVSRTSLSSLLSQWEKTGVSERKHESTCLGRVMDGRASLVSRNTQWENRLPGASAVQFLMGMGGRG